MLKNFRALTLLVLFCHPLLLASAEPLDNTKNLLKATETKDYIKALKLINALEVEHYKAFLIHLGEFLPEKFGDFIAGDKPTTTFDHVEFAERRYHPTENSNQEFVARIYPFTLEEGTQWDNIKGSERCTNEGRPAQEFLRKDVQPFDVGFGQGSIGKDFSLTGKTFMTVAVCMKGAVVQFSLLNGEDEKENALKLKSLIKEFNFKGLESYTQELETK